MSSGCNFVKEQAEAVDYDDAFDPGEVSSQTLMEVWVAQTRGDPLFEEAKALRHRDPKASASDDPAPLIGWF